MTAAVVAGLLAGYGIAIPVGAVSAYLVSLTARTGLRAGIGAALGVASADGLYALVAMIGGTAAARLLAPVLLPLRWASALVLVVLALRTGIAAVRRYRTGSRDEIEVTAIGPVRAYFGLLGMTALNPLTVVYFTALVLGGSAAMTGNPGEQAVFVLAAFVASASWQVLLACGGALLGKVLTGSRGRLVTATASSALVIALAIRLVT
ncbi:LysE/ArgO family amino acid transporter [Amycolatopsis minnesotensis]|uniref:LysE family transporter n=1 Tax=Amycolatopsis minnesotensis TaxID=337894 RepID=A0ABN2SUY8_9PSEU